MSKSRVIDTFDIGGIPFRVLESEEGERSVEILQHLIWHPIRGVKIEETSGPSEFVVRMHV